MGHIWRLFRLPTLNQRDMTPDRRDDLAVATLGFDQIGVKPGDGSRMAVLGAKEDDWFVGRNESGGLLDALIIRSGMFHGVRSQNL